MKAVTFSSVTSEWKKEVVEDTSSVSGVTVKMTCTKAGTAGFHRNFYDLRSRIGATMTFQLILSVQNLSHSIWVVNSVERKLTK